LDVRDSVTILDREGNQQIGLGHMAEPEPADMSLEYENFMRPICSIGMAFGFLFLALLPRDAYFHPPFEQVHDLAVVASTRMVFYSSITHRFRGSARVATCSDML
jgi:hypothetical protein